MDLSNPKINNKIMSGLCLQMYRDIFDDYEKGIEHYLVICSRIKHIVTKDIEKCNEQETQFKLFIELMED